MSRSRRRRHSLPIRIAKWLGVALIVIVPVLAVGVLLIDWNWVKGAAGDRLSGALGREVAIDGDLDIDFGWVPRVTATGVRVANADWAGPDDMLQVERLTFRIDLREMLHGDVVLPEVTIAGGDLNLVRKDDGTANWDFAPASEAGAAAEAVTPEDRGDIPVIRRLLIEDSTLRYHDAVENIDIDSEIAQVKGTSESEDRLTLKGEGTFEGRPFTLDVDGGSVLRLHETENPYPLRIAAAVGRTQIVFDGTFRNLVEHEVFDIALDVSGPNLSELFPIFGIPLPPTPPYSLTGRLKRNGPLWTVSGLDGRVGDSDLSGDLSVDTNAEPPVMKADLLSEKLDLDDLAGFIGAPPETGEGETASARQERLAREEAADRRVLSDMPIALTRLRAMNMAVEFTGKRIEAPNLPLESLDVVIHLDDGVLTLEPVTFGVAKGTIGGTLVLDGRMDTPHVRADLLLREVGLKPFFRKTDMADLTEGRFSGKFVLEGDGRSLAEVLASGDGRALLAMSGGSLSPLLVEMVGLDIAESLAVVVSDADTPVPIRCAFGAFDIREGAMRSDGIVIDTADSTIVATGAINLGTEKLSLHVHADPKDPSLLSANAPIAVSGTLKEPAVSIDPTLTAGEGLFDTIVSLADPILALLPVVDLGTAEDRRCAALLQGDVKGSKQESRRETKN
jgi:hypothetical protein